MTDAESEHDFSSIDKLPELLLICGQVERLMGGAALLITEVPATDANSFLTSIRQSLREVEITHFDRIMNK